ncbi:hypothetical protein CYY_006964 [Polysphondylium violaceum]|uniref:AAA+ ATPase domain-containing protein n=1 Tax=Polysphondylium violaceum TaxID=133409 RepID=A0A8J4PSK8_9MYCE|nr:hypothetical protein CYY_006964 [Polysphondylium violaceum]
MDIEDNKIQFQKTLVKIKKTADNYQGGVLILLKDIVTLIKYNNEQTNTLNLEVKYLLLESFGFMINHKSFQDFQFKKGSFDDIVLSLQQLSNHYPFISLCISLVLLKNYNSNQDAIELDFLKNLIIKHLQNKYFNQDDMSSMDDEEDINTANEETNDVKKLFTSTTKNIQQRRLRFLETQILGDLFLNFFSTYTTYLNSNGSGDSFDLDNDKHVEFNTVLSLFTIDITTTRNQVLNKNSNRNSQLEWSLKFIKNLNNDIFLNFYQLIPFNKIEFFKLYIKNDIEINRIFSLLQVTLESDKNHMVDYLVEFYIEHSKSNLLIDLFNISSNIINFSESCKSKIGFQLFNIFIQNPFDFIKQFHLFFSNNIFQSNFRSILLPIIKKNCNNLNLLDIKYLLLERDLYKYLFGEEDQILNQINIPTKLNLETQEIFTLLSNINSLKISQILLSTLNLHQLLEFSIKDLNHLNPLSFSFAIKKKYDIEKEFGIINEIIKFETTSILDQKTNHFKAICQTLVDISIDDFSIIELIENINPESILWYLYLIKYIELNQNSIRIDVIIKSLFEKESFKSFYSKSSNSNSNNNNQEYFKKLQFLLNRVVQVQFIKRIEIISINYEPELRDEYNNILEILKLFDKQGSFQEVEILEAKYHQDKKYYPLFLKYVDFMKRFGFSASDFIVGPREVFKQIDQYSNYFQTNSSSSSTTTFTISSWENIVEIIEFIGSFRLNKITIFSILFEDFSTTEKNINQLVNLVKMYFKNMINEISLPLNLILERILNDPLIDLKREFEFILSFHNIQDNEIYNEWIKIIDTARMFFIFNRDIQYFIQYLNNSKDYISIKDIDQFNENLASLKQLSSINPTVSLDINNRINQLIGSNNIYHLQLFQGISKTLLEWFSKFNDIQNFVSQCQIINDRLSMELDRSENTTLVNNADYAFKSIASFVSYFKQYYRTEPVKTRLNTFADVLAFFNTSFPDPNKAVSSFTILNTVTKNIDKIKLIFESYTLDDSKNVAKIVQMIVNENIKFISNIDSWCIVANNVSYSQDLIDDLYRGLDLATWQEKNKTWINTFKKYYKDIKKIHKIHQQLIGINHPSYPHGTIQVSIQGGEQNTFSEKIVKLKNQYNDWLDKVNRLPNQLLLLRPHGISSFYNIIDKYLCSLDSETILVLDQISQLSSLIYPYIQYCFPAIQKMDESLIIATINKNIKLKSTRNTYEFLLIFFNFFESELKLKLNFNNNNPTDNNNLKIIKVKNYNNIYNCCFLVNGNTPPHPSQIFFTNPQEDFDYQAFEKISNLDLYPLNYFLIGVSKNKQDLFQWISKQNSKKSCNCIYIIVSINNNSDFMDFLNYITNIEIKDTDYTQFKNYYQSNKFSIKSSILTGKGKTFYFKNHLIKNSDASQETLVYYLRPGWDRNELITKLNQLKSSNKKKVLLYFNISSFSSFDRANIFFYSFLLFGSMMDLNNHQLFSLYGIEINLYIEFGASLESSIGEIEYINNSFPLLYYLSNTVTCKLDWVINELVLKCFRYVYYIKDFNFDYSSEIEFFQKPQQVNTNFTEPYGLKEFSQDIKQLLENQFPANYSFPSIEFLLDNNYLHERKAFFLLLNEKLKYFDVFIDNNTTHHFDSIGKLFPWVLLECLWLTCPKTYINSNHNIWENPPTISKTLVNHAKSRVLKDRVEPTDVHMVEFIDFNQNFSKYQKSIDRYATVNLFDPKWAQYIYTLENKIDFFQLIGRFFSIDTFTKNPLILEKICSDSGYILTPEFGLRLVILHDKLKYQKSVVLSGGTGVGKTKMLYFYSLILNYQYVQETQHQFNLNFIKELNRIVEKRNTPSISKIQNVGEIHRIPELIEDIARDKPIAAKDFVNQIGDFIMNLLSKNHLVNISKNSQLSMFESKLKKGSFTLEDAKSFSKMACNQLNYIKVYHRFVMHLKYTSDLFKQDLLDIFQDARHLLSSNSDIKILIFIDEFNTSPLDTLSIINEIFMDNTVDGKEIPPNIYWVGAMNPLTKINPESSLAGSSIDFTGVENAELHNNVFIVQPTPPSMNKILFNFGEFSQSNERPFLDCLFKIKHKELDKSFSQHLIEVITECQSFLRNGFIRDTKIHPSIRDVMRCSKLYEFFTTDSVGVQMLLSTNFFTKEEKNSYFEEKQKQHYLNLSLSLSSSHIMTSPVVPTFLLNKDLLHWLSLIASICICYYQRIPTNFRKQFKEKISLWLANRMDSCLKAFTFTKIFKEIVDGFSDKIKPKIPKGVALTQSLQLNIFTMIVSIKAGIPLLIVGPPGCSKTLSLSIVIDIMNDNKVNTREKSNLDKGVFLDMPNIYTLKYQCTPYTSDEEIKKKYTQAIGHQDFFLHTKHVVFLDEAGLIKEQEAPMKILHDYLDKEQHVATDKNISNIETVILSNKILDAAKNNRMLILIHSDNIDSKDEEILVSTCLPMIDKLGDQEMKKKITHALCQGYRSANQFTKDTKENLFHQRDFVFFLRHLNRTLERKDTPTITSDILLESLERNFNGIDFNSFKSLAQVFFNGFGFTMNSLENRIIDRIQDSLSESLDLANNPNNSAFRFIMIIDPSDNESSLAILKEMNKNAKVIRVGGFHNDTTISSLVDLFSEIKREMTSGGTVILVNTQIIDQCFYDVFNRYFITLSSKENEVSLWATISFGTHTVHQKVHPNFKIIVLQPLSTLHNVQLPWLNRFEKYQLTTETFVEHYFLSNKQTRPYKALLESTNFFISNFQQNEKFYLFGHQSGTNHSLVYSMLYKQSSMNPIRDSNLKLLLLGKPEKILDCKWIPYMNEYIFDQEHLSILNFIKSLTNNENRKKMYTIYTRSSIDLYNLTSQADQFNVLQMSKFKSSISLKKKLVSFFDEESASSLPITLLVCDMKETLTSQINSVVDLYNQLKDNNQKSLILILHYPHELLISNQVKFSVNYIHPMEYMYIDSLGINNDNDDIKSWMAKGFGLDTLLKNQSLYEILKPLLFNQISSIVKHNIKFDSNDAETLDKNSIKQEILNTFYEHPEWCKEIIDLFITQHQQSGSLQNVFSIVLSECSSTISSGNSMGNSFIDLIKESMSIYLHPVLLKVIRALFSQSSLKNISPDSDQDYFVKLFIKSLVIKLSSSRSDPIVISRNQEDEESIDSIILYDQLSDNIFLLIDKIVNEFRTKSTISAPSLYNNSNNNNNNIKLNELGLQQMVQKLEESIKKSNMNDLIKFIESKSEIRESIVQEFLIKTVKILKPSKWLGLFQEIIDILTKQWSSFSFAKYWSLYYVQQDLLSFINDIVDCLYGILEKDNKKTRDQLSADIIQCLKSSGSGSNDQVQKEMMKLVINRFSDRFNQFFATWELKLKKESQESTEVFLSSLGDWTFKLSIIFNIYPIEKLLKNLLDVEPTLFTKSTHIYYNYYLALSIFIKNATIYKDQFISEKQNVGSSFLEIFEKCDRTNNDLFMLDIIKPLVPLKKENIIEFMMVYTSPKYKIPQEWVKQIIMDIIESTSQRDIMEIVEMVKDKIGSSIYFIPDVYSNHADFLNTKILNISSIDGNGSHFGIIHILYNTLLDIQFKLNADGKQGLLIDINQLIKYQVESQDLYSKLYSLVLCRIVMDQFIDHLDTNCSNNFEEKNLFKILTNYQNSLYLTFILQPDKGQPNFIQNSLNQFYFLNKLKCKNSNLFDSFIQSRQIMEDVGLLNLFEFKIESPDLANTLFSILKAFNPPKQGIISSTKSLPIFSDTHFKLFKYYDEKSNVLSVSKDFPKILEFIRLFRKFFYLRLPRDYLHRPIQDAFDLLVQFETKESIDTLLLSWNQCKSLLQLDESTTTLSKIVSFSTALGSTGNTAFSKDVFSLLFKEWKEITDQILNLKNDYLEENDEFIRPQFNQIFGSDGSAHRYDKYLGSNYKEYLLFCMDLSIKYQNDVSLLQKDSISIQNRLISFFISQKNTFIEKFFFLDKEFPFSLAKKNSTSANEDEKVNSFLSVYPDSIKTLKKLVSDWSDYNLHNPFNDEQQFKELVKQIPYHQLLSLSEYFVETILLITDNIQDNISLDTFSKKTLFEFNPYFINNGNGGNDVEPMEFKSIFERTLVSSLFRISTILIKGCSIFDRLYCGIIFEPNPLEQKYVDLIDNIENTITQDTLNGSNTRQWIEALTNTIQSLSLPVVKQIVSVQKAKFKDILKNFANNNCLLITNLLKEENLPLTYYPILMRKLVKILTQLDMIKNNQKSTITTTFVEPKWEFNIKVNNDIVNNNNSKNNGINNVLDKKNPIINNQDKEVKDLVNNNNNSHNNSINNSISSNSNFNDKILYDRNIFIKLLQEKSKFNQEFIENIIGMGIDCYSVVLNLKKEEWTSSSIKIPLGKRNELINLTKLELPADVKKSYAFDSYPIDMQSENVLKTFLIDIIGIDNQTTLYNDLGFTSLVNILPADDDASYWDELVDELTPILKPAKLFNLISQLKELKIN